MKIKHKSLLPLYLEGMVRGKFTLAQASASTGYSVPYLCSLKKRFVLQGASVFEHKNKFKIPPNKKSEALCNRIVSLYASEYKDINFRYFTKCLNRYEGIKICYTTLCRIMGRYGIRSPEAHKVKRTKTAHRMRVRRECEGDLLQIDGTPYAWFYRFGNNKRYCLSGAIDDATGKITALYITEFECLYGYLEVLRQTARSFGLPREIYSDRAAIFCVTPKNRNHKGDFTRWEMFDTIHSERTQWQRILNELHINQILAWSPEAKGRVERMWRTIQGQLPLWLYKHGCSSVEEANRILYRYVDEFNSDYAITAEVDDAFWLSAPADLDDILCAQISRKTDRAGVFSFHSYKFELLTEFASYRTFTLCISERGIFGRLSDGLYVPVRCLDEPLSGLGETMPIVVQNIIYRYLFAFAKEISA